MKMKLSMITMTLIYSFTIFLFMPSPSPMMILEEYTYKIMSNSSMILYSPNYLPTLMFLTYILLLTLMAVVKICSFNSAPLRPYI